MCVEARHVARYGGHIRLYGKITYRLRREWLLSTSLKREFAGPRWTFPRNCNREKTSADFRTKYFSPHQSPIMYEHVFIIRVQ
jgi:hypothetical protein